MRLRTLLAWCVAACFGCGSAAAQDLTVNVNGGPEGATRRIAGATVCLGTAANRSQLGHDTADANGVAVFENVQRGSWTFTAAAAGYVGKSRNVDVGSTDETRTIRLDDGPGGPTCGGFFVTPPADAPPSAPTGLAVFVSDPSTLRVDWGDVSGATSYVLQRWQVPRFGGSPTFTDVALPTTSAHLDPGLSTGFSYDYRAAARNANGTSAFTAAVRGTLPPGVPGTPRLTPGPGSLTVDWDRRYSATSYVVERRTAGGTFAQLGTPQGPPIVDSGLSFTMTYEYRVAARSAAGTSAFSVVGSGVPQLAPQATVQADIDPALIPRITSLTVSSFGFTNPAAVPRDAHLLLIAPHTGPMPTHWRASTVSQADLASKAWQAYEVDFPGVVPFGLLPNATAGRRTFWFQYKAGSAASAVATDGVELYAWTEHRVDGSDAIRHAAGRGYAFTARETKSEGLRCEQGEGRIRFTESFWGGLYVAWGQAFESVTPVSHSFSPVGCEFGFFEEKQLAAGWRTKEAVVKTVKPNSYSSAPPHRFSFARALAARSRDADFVVSYVRDAQTRLATDGVLWEVYPFGGVMLETLVLEGPPGADWRQAFGP